MLDTDYPIVLEINAHRLTALAADSGNPVDMGTPPLELLQNWREAGFDAIWVMGIWERGEAGRHASLTEPEFREEFNTCLPDWTEADVAGSPFAIRSYIVDPEFGGESALESLRQRLQEQGIGLILDFVPNHTALDHPWVSQHPEYYVQGNEALLESEPWNYVRAGDRILAHGRDPYFNGWKDTLQLDYRLAEVRKAMIQTLLGIAQQCDGVRCDMAMLQLRNVFHRTWGAPEQDENYAEGYEEFWAEAIDTVRRQHPNFHFLAEAYWGLEEKLQKIGFDYTYHKTIYDTLVEGSYDQLRLRIGPPTQACRSVFFLENHDERRAARAIPDSPERRAATFFVLTQPGLRLLHDSPIDSRRPFTSAPEWS